MELYMYLVHDAFDEFVFWKRSASNVRRIFIRRFMISLGLVQRRHVAEFTGEYSDQMPLYHDLLSFFMYTRLIIQIRETFES